MAFGQLSQADEVTKQLRRLMDEATKRGGTPSVPEVSQWLSFDLDQCGSARGSSRFYLLTGDVDVRGSQIKTE
jgi:hypothetical protein